MGNNLFLHSINVGNKNCDLSNHGSILGGRHLLQRSWLDRRRIQPSFTNCSDTVAKHWHSESHRARVDVIEFIKISMYIPSVSRLPSNVLPFRFANLPTHF